jgi:predicted alpha/beta hydrolase
MRHGFERIQEKMLRHMGRVKTGFALLFGLGLAILTGFDKRLAVRLTGMLSH